VGFRETAGKSKAALARPVTGRLRLFRLVFGASKGTPRIDLRSTSKK